MLLYPPIRFDENEVFILIILAIVWFLIFYLPRQLSALEILLIWTFNVFLVFSADMTLAVPPADLYDSNDRMTYEFFDFLIFTIGYPPFAYLAINYFKKKSYTLAQSIIFILICAFLTTVIEIIALLFNVFTFKGWLFHWSFFVYILVYGLNVLLFYYIQQKKAKNISYHIP